MSSNNSLAEAKIQRFLDALAPHLRADRITVDGNDFVVGEWRVACQQVLSFWEFPNSVEVLRTGRRQKYRCTKNGFNLPKIAQEVKYEIAAKVVAAKAKRERSRNHDASNQLRDRLGIREYSNLVRPSANADKPVYVELKVSAAMTVEQAERVISFLREEGVLSKYEFN